MSIHRWAKMGLLVVLGAVSLGCQAQSKQSSVAAPAGPEEVEQIRRALQAQNPKVQVGVVLDVLPEENLVSVGDINASDFHDRDVVCFMDSNSQPLVCGKVVRITESQVHVKYEMPQADRRPPMRGDIAVAFP